MPINSIEIYLKTFSMSVLSYLLFFFSGIFLIKYLNVRKYRIILIWSWIIYSLVVAFNITNDEKGFRLAMHGEQIYLMLADAYAVLCIFIFSIAKSKKLKVLVFLIASVLLFTMLSRTTLYFFVFTIILYFTIKQPKIIVLFFISGIIFMSFTDLTDLMNSRMGERMFGLILGNEDSSAESRSHTFTNGISNLKSNFLFGDLLGDVRDNYGITGSYIHNYLSFWANFGLIPFLMLLFLIFTNGLLIYKRLIFKKFNSNIEIFLFIYFTFFLLEIIFSRAYLSSYIWFVFSAAPIALGRKEKYYSRTEKTLG